MIHSYVLGKSAMTSLYDHTELLALHGAALITRSFQFDFSNRNRPRSLCPGGAIAVISEQTRIINRTCFCSRPFPISPPR